MTTTPFLLAIVGGAASGKTTLAHALRSAYAPDAGVVSEDDYYRCATTIPRFDASSHNFDAPEAKDHALLHAHLRALKAGEPAASPEYCFASHARIGVRPATAPTRLIIVEGLHLLVAAEGRALFDASVFVETPADVRLARRVLRDTAERGRTVQSVIAQYEGTVRPMHAAAVAPQAPFSSLVVNGEAPVARLVEEVRAFLATKL